ncbi:MAG TPA: LytTR family DNA-binding domain-containing protein [Allosphingosinicella sp.]|nr:LytTR family DNA-binding domain-containing protein [Allosphingosinicella sp.]
MAELRALLVDDEPLAIRRLSRSLERVAGIEVVGATTSARQAVALIDSEHPDMVFLDISMPGLSGFEVLERISPQEHPAVVFVTAYDSHAVQAFDVAAADYLMKPYAQDRLEEAVGRGRLWLEARAARATTEGASAGTPLESLWVHRHNEFVRVPVGEVSWIEAHGDYVKIHGARQTGLARATLTSLERRLDRADFMRVHRSAICRKAAVVSLRRKPSGAVCVLLDNGDEAPVGRAFVPGLRALLRRVAR